MLSNWIKVLWLIVIVAMFGCIVWELHEALVVHGCH